MAVEKWAALLTIRAPGKMERRQVVKLVQWLRNHAEDLERDHKKYTDKLFHGRFNK